MTEPTHTISVSLRVTRAAGEPWLVGAFLILFGVAITAAMPPISAAVRGAMTDAASDGAERADRKASVRLRLLSVRLAEPAAPQGVDAALVAQDCVGASPAGERVFARPIDLAAQLRQRGFSARAPPAQSA